MYLEHYKNVPFIGLPGNPVSCTVVFLTLYDLGYVKSWVFHKNYFYQPFKHNWMKILKKIMVGQNSSEWDYRSETIYFAKRATGNQSSAWMSSIACGDGLFYVDSTPNQKLHKGSSIEISLFPWKQHLVFS